MAALRVLSSVGLLATPLAQQIGTNTPEQHPEVALSTCDSQGCIQDMKPLVLDSNWRWVHDKQLTNCYGGDASPSAWDSTICPNPETCAENCFMEGASLEDYHTKYGVTAEDDGLRLNFVTKHKYGSNFGSRVYMMEDDSSYKMFMLKNREFTLTVDMDHMPCGLNGAVYFVEMEADGGKGHGFNTAGAKYGTGYCDAQCPHDMKFIKGLANVDDWNSTSDPPVGKWGICCAEMDIWEANSRATAYTPHPCSIKGSYRCMGEECGDNEAKQRYDGVCDKDGCDYNSYRLGNHTFYGRHAEFSVDSTKPLTVVTQFITKDGTDTGELSDIKRFYVQDGQTIPNSASSIAGVSGNSVTDDMCSEMKKAFGDINDFGLKGGLKAMGEALDRGMVLVMSLWDDSQSNMLWLDSDYPVGESVYKAGVERGPCKTSSGSPSYLRKTYPTASVKFHDIKVGTIGSTFGVAQGGGSNLPDDPWGQDRRLADAEVVV